MDDFLKRGKGIWENKKKGVRGNKVGPCPPQMDCSLCVLFFIFLECFFFPFLFLSDGMLGRLRFKKNFFLIFLILQNFLSPKERGDVGRV